MTLLLRQPLQDASGWCRLSAPAKVNLWLELTGRRSDGYHLIDSVFVFPTIADHVSALPASDGRLSLALTGPEAGSLEAFGADDDNNLVIRAAKLLLDEARSKGHSGPLGAEIILDKHLPVASGIGGGSGDAAAALLVLNHVWRLGLKAPRLEALAATLGADVPAALYSTPQHVSGIGEVLDTAIYEGPSVTVLVNPRKAVSTPDVFAAYKSLNMPFSAPPGPVDGKERHTEPITLDTVLGRSNDLAAPAQTLCPEIVLVMDEMRTYGPGARLIRMSGSGATCFALFDKTEEAQSFANTLSAVYPDWWVAVGDFA